ncbi:ABC transporter permease [Hymenobacter sp. CRA2]|uniref:ABC transporter permease n=1 Tax=Hymenobacter sp. CRA2 TaxID=1955620 RepID=UPI0009902265|nr:ABC transporter permease [Hymenobacter sp. CRA2]OON66202.1 hypothetical protein B0919_22190 [Hymenobacter sp. CRA2]
MIHATKLPKVLSQQRHPVLQRITVAWLVALVLMGVLPFCWPGIWPKPLANLDALSQPPSRLHWLGTDPFGRDVLADILAGAQQLITVGAPAAVLASTLGTGLGAAAGYWHNHRLRVRKAAWLILALGLGGTLITSPAALPWWLLGIVAGTGLVYLTPALRASWPLPLDQLVQSAAAFLTSVPRLVIVVVLAAAQPPSKPWLIFLLVLTCWPGTARLVRAQIAQLRSQPYIEAGRAAGYSDFRLLRYHLLPNAWPALRAVLPLNLSLCLALQTTLAFLGIGLPPDQPNWGRTLANARLEPTAWWVILAGVLPLAFTIGALHTLTLRRKAVHTIQELTS